MPAVNNDSFPGAGKAASNGAVSEAEIIDIRREHADLDLKKEIESMINPAEGPKMLPTLLLYDEKGLQLFEDITYLDEYYLTNNEINVLTRHAADIASQIPSGAIVVELGSGNLRKVCLLLQAFEDAGKTIDYYALDLSRDELTRTLAQLPPFEHVTHRGLLGTYDDGRDWLAAHSRDDDRARCILHMGSSIGNFSRDEAAGFLGQFADVMRTQDMMIVGVDSCMRPDKVHRAYNDSQGVTHKFILNGLTHANRLFKRDVFNLEDWRVIGEYVYDNNEQGGRHQAFLSPLRDVNILGQRIRRGERIKIEQSLKYTNASSQKLWALAGLEETERWTYNDEHGLHLLRKSPTPFSHTNPLLYAENPLPSLDEWSALWRAWHTVTRQMLPDAELSEKPIRLRNACIFYLGHIPTFLDIQLTKTLPGSHPTSPSLFQAIFERGIDPDVDDPSRCHQHSEIPDEWPSLDEILSYQERVRDRLRTVYERGEMPRSVGRAVWLAFEHELMHLETLLYMMVQSDKTLPPPDVPRPDFEKMAREAKDAAVENEWFDVPAQKIRIGMEDPEDGTDPRVQFGWDNEKPVRDTQVHAFQAKGRPITNGEYVSYMLSSNITTIPATWTTSSSNGTNGTHTTNGANGHSNGSPSNSFIADKSILTVFGPVPLALALDWPVMASYDELTGCAAWMGGRIPTFEEARSIYTYVEDMKTKDSLNSKLANKVPAVNGHLVNDGVEETPPFIDLASTTTAFRAWHPTPVTHKGDRLAGQSDLGGAWEWTSSTLEAWEGFSAMPMYPGYTADFFDGLHNIVLGGSWATHPRIAGRRSFVNWYQRKYRYAWVGARLVRDV